MFSFNAYFEEVSRTDENGLLASLKPENFMKNK